MFFRYLSEKKFKKILDPEYSQFLQKQTCKAKIKQNINNTTNF